MHLSGAVSLRLHHRSRIRYISQLYSWKRVALCTGLASTNSSCRTLHESHLCDPHYAAGLTWTRRNGIKERGCGGPCLCRSSLAYVRTDRITLSNNARKSLSGISTEAQKKGYHTPSFKINSTALEALPEASSRNFGSLCSLEIHPLMYAAALSIVI